MPRTRTTFTAVVDYDRMRELHDQHRSAAQIADELGCSARTVTRWRRAVGVAEPVPDHASHYVTPERLAAAQRLLEDGASHREVARTLGMHTHTLHRHFPDHAWTRTQISEYANLVRSMNANELLKGTTT